MCHLFKTIITILKNNKIMKKYIISILLLVATILSHKVTATNSDYNKYIPIMTPESATLGQYGAFPVSLYTGSVDISIPIHTLKTNNITVPISLQYNGTGFIPNKDCGKIGHDWALVAGGVITRTVNGVPDEWISGAGGADYDLHGILNFGSDAPSGTSLRNLSFLAPGIPNTETTPDLFSFNFCGQSGQFMIDHNGNVKVVGGKAYKVDITGLQRQRLSEPTAISTIVITDGNGTKYTFGGDINALEINLKRLSTSLAYIPNGVIGAFYLTRIETTDGEYVEFFYNDSKEPYSNFVSTEGHYDGTNIIRNGHFTDYYQNISNIGESEVVYNPGGPLGVSYTKGVYLHQIITSAGETATFVYNSRYLPFCNTTEDNFWTRPFANPKLDYIQITNACDDTICNTTLFQSYSTSYNHNSGTASNTGRMFLDSVVVNQQKYSMEYTSRESLPMSYTRGIDMQGYYNGNNSNSNLLGVGSTATAANFSGREPSFDNASKAMIKKIVYPTGGYSEFVFENHTCGKAVVIDPNSGMLPALKTVSRTGQIGGLRIKEIKNTPGETISYQYTNSAETLSSGVVNDTKRYNANIDVSSSSWTATSLTIYSSTNILAGNNVAEPEVGYSRVVERRGNGNGYKVYNYTTFEDFKDEPILESQSSTLSYSTSATQNDIVTTLWHTSRHLDRGSIIKEEVYSSDNILVKEILYEYNNTNDIRSNYAIYSCGYRLYADNKTVANSVAHYYYPKHVISQTVRELLGNTWHTVKTDYTYSQHNQLPSQEAVTNSNDEVNVKKTFYPKDFASNTIMMAMCAQNMLNTIVKEEYYCNNVLTHTIENEFAAYTGTSSNTNYYDICTVKETNIGNPTYNAVEIHSRGKNRNIESMTESGKPVTSYLWSYCNQYPIAKLENVTAAQLANIPEQTRIAISSSSNPYNDYSSTLAQLETLFPQALITRYDYKPQIGMTYCQEPNGLQHYYEYDSSGRLTSVAIGAPSSVVKGFGYNLLNKAIEVSPDDDVTAPDFYVEFTSIEDHVTVDYGCYTSTATIVCDAPVTVTFSILCDVMSSAQYTTYGCRIGDSYTLTQSSQWPEKEFTVELEAGENIIELYVNDLVGTASIELIIEGVEDANAAVGENSYLHLSTDKTN